MGISRVRGRMRVLLFAFGVLLVAGGLAQRASAGIADPDTNFGTGGVALQPAASGGVAHYGAIATLGDGSSIVAGEQVSAGTPQTRQLLLLHLDISGQVDPGFGTAAGGTSGLNGYAANAIALQPDGKIVVAGAETPSVGNNRLFVMRFTSTGQPDPAFHGGVPWVLPSSTGLTFPAVGTGVAVEPNGQIFAVGTLHNEAVSGTIETEASTVAVQLNADGTPDSSFHSPAGDPAQNVDGVSVGPARSGGVEHLNAVGVDSAGRVTAVGDFSQTTPLVERFVTTGTGAGSLDSSFGTNGRVTLAAPATMTLRDPYATAMAVLGSGQILVLSHGFSGPGARLGTILLDRLNADGTTDTTFGTGGYVIDVPSSDNAQSIDALAVDATGLIYVGGDATQGTGKEFFLTRFTAAGAIDSSFDPGASHPESTTATAGDGGLDDAFGLTVDTVKRPIIVGDATNGGAVDAAAMRFGGTSDRPKPVAKATYTPVHAGAPIRPGQAVTLDGSGSSDPNPNALDKFEWDTDEGTFAASGPTVVIHPTGTGKHTATLKMTSSDGLSNTDSVTYDVEPNSNPSINDVTVTPSAPKAGKPVTYHADAVDDGSVVSYAWAFGPDATPSSAAASSAPDATVQYGAGGKETYILTVTDDEGATALKTGTIQVAPPPCAGASGVTAGRVTVLALVPTGNTCLHVSTATDPKTGQVDTTATTIGAVSVNGITVTPTTPGTSDQTVFTAKVKKDGTVISETLTSSSATVSGVARNAPTVFNIGAVKWDLSGDTIGGFTVSPNAAVAGMQVTMPKGAAPTLNSDKHTSTIQLTPSLPSSFAPEGGSPSQPISVTFGQGDVAGGNAPPGVEAAAAYPAIAASGGSEHNPCDDSSNGGFDFCVQNIDLGVANVKFLHVYYDPNFGTGVAAWGAEAAVTINVGEQGPFDVAAGLEFTTDQSTGKTAFHQGYAALGGPGQTPVDTGIIQIHYIAFQITMAPPGRPDLFTQTDLHPGDVPALEHVAGTIDSTGVDPSKSDTTCVADVGWKDLYWGESLGYGNSPVYPAGYNSPTVPPAGATQPYGAGYQTRQLLNSFGSIGNQGIGDYVASQTPHGLLSPPYPYDYGTPDLALCGGVGLGLFDVLSVDATFGYDDYPAQHAFPQGADVFQFDGSVSILGIIKASIYGQFWSTGYINGGLTVGYTIPGIVSFNGGANVEIYKKLFNAEGFMAVDVPLIDLSAQANVLFSNKGYAVCLKLSAFGVDWSPGIDDTWNTKFPHIPNIDLGGCDVGPYKESIAPQTATVRQRWTGVAFRTAAAVPGARGVQVPKGAPGFTIAAVGAGAPPHLTVVSPSGQEFDTGEGTDPVQNASGLAVHNATENTTSVAIHDPQAGNWQILPAPDSAPVTNVKTAIGISEIKGHATVSGKGQDRTLHYKLSGLGSGDKVMLSEDGKGGQLIGQLSGVHASAAADSPQGAPETGKMDFNPAPGIAGPRTLMALVYGPDGLPRQQITLGSYKAPPAPAPAKATKIAFKVHGKSIAVTWRQPSGAAKPRGYTVNVRTSDGRDFNLVATKARVTIPAVGPGVKVTVTITSKSSTGISSKPAKASFKTKAPKKPGHHRKPGKHHHKPPRKHHKG